MEVVEKSPEALSKAIEVAEAVATIHPNYDSELQALLQDKEQFSTGYSQTKTALIHSIQFKASVSYCLYCIVCLPLLVVAIVLLALSISHRDDEDRTTCYVLLGIGLGLFVALLLSFLAIFSFTYYSAVKAKKKIRWLDAENGHNNCLASWKYERARWNEFAAEEYGLTGREAKHFFGNLALLLVAGKREIFSFHSSHCAQHNTNVDFFLLS